MIAVPRPIASLSSGLLARKGQARPAMRRQATLAEAGDDLGWNDMGEPLAFNPQHPPVALTPPPVLTERVELAQTLAAEIEADEPPVLGKSARKAAFTLRLDADRHLRLRLAAATGRVSAQKLVTQALDQLLGTMPELEALAKRAGTVTDRLGD